MKRPALPALCLALVTAGCSMVPEFSLPDGVVPAAWRNEAPSAPETTAITPPAAWWTSFRSPELDRLTALALERNRDLGAAVARVVQAEAQARIAGAPLLPSLGATGQGQVGQQAQRTATTSTRTTSGRTTRSYQGALTASYELDVWGANRAAAESAGAALQSSQYSRDTVALTLTASVATTWFQSLALADRVQAARRNLAIARETLALIEAQAAFGKISGLEAAQQRSNVALIEAQVPSLELQRQQAVDGLAILVGLPPSQLTLTGGTLTDIAVPEVAPGLPSDLLRRRPDIRSAESNLLAANADIGLARARLFPTIQLTADGGYASAALSGLMAGGSSFYSLATAITASIFDNGRLSGTVDLNQARRDELVHAYHQAVLAALRDVEDALAATSGSAEQEQAQTRAVTAAREAQQLADTRFRAGAADYLTVLDAQRTLLQAEDGLIQVRLARLNAAAGLAKALGGGATAAAPTPAPPHGGGGVP